MKRQFLHPDIPCNTYTWMSDGTGERSERRDASGIGMSLNEEQEQRGISFSLHHFHMIANAVHVLFNLSNRIWAELDFLLLKNGVNIDKTDDFCILSNGNCSLIMSSDVHFYMSCWMQTRLWFYCNIEKKSHPFSGNDTHWPPCTLLSGHVWRWLVFIEFLWFIRTESAEMRDSRGGNAHVECRIRFISASTSEQRWCGCCQQQIHIP